MKKIIMLALVFFNLTSLTLMATNPSKIMNETQKEMKEIKSADHLLIVWTSGDPDVAHKMVFMYAFNAQKNGWWEQVTLLVWGPSAKLSSQDKDIQESLKNMKEQGVELLACKGCADQYGVSAKLEELGIEVKYTGTYLTDFIKSGKKVISF
ncbi:MAG: DsrE family protein [Bacteroidales bacterium]|nr:DsrE family protein [Bacteroidales bacterium]